MRTRERQIIIRMTDDEAAAFKKRLAKSKLRQNSFALKCLLNKQINVIDDEQELIRQLKAVGNNLNQIARAINSEQIAPLQAIASLEKGAEELWRLLKQLKVAGR